MSNEPLKKLSLIHYYVIDQLLESHRVEEIVYGLQTAAVSFAEGVMTFGEFISVKDVLDWMSDPLFEKEYLKAREGRGRRTIVYEGVQKKKC